MEVVDCRGFMCIYVYRYMFISIGVYIATYLCIIFACMYTCMHVYMNEWMHAPGAAQVSRARDREFDSSSS